MRVQLIDQEEPAFQMAPMIDMVFLLLVFFMCASHLNQRQNMPMNVPTAAKAVVPKERPNRWVVNITEDGSLFSGNTPMEIDVLADRIKTRLGETPDLRIYIRADAACEHRHVKKAMNALAEVGADDFIFGVYIPTDNPEGAP